MNDKIKDCTQCEYYKGMSNPAKGVKIPGGYGKCIRPGGHCSPDKVNKGFGNTGEKEMDESAITTQRQRALGLSCDDFKRLEELEKTISENFQAFYVVGCALAEIQVNKLYTATHETFEDYCRERFEIARRTAYQYIETSTAMNNLRNCAQIAHIENLPANEAQVRPLTRLEPEKQVEAWEEAVKSAPDGRVTAKHVAGVVRQILGEQVRKKADKLTDDKNVPADIVSPEFREAYWVLVQVVRSEMTAGPIKEKTRTRMLENIQGLAQLLSD